MRTYILLVGLLLTPVVQAGEVTVCNSTNGPAVAIRLNEKVAEGETTEQTVARRLARTLEQRADLDAASCVTMAEEALPASQDKRYAWRVANKRVTVDPNVPKPVSETTEIPVEVLGGALSGTLAALGVASLTGRTRKEPS